jgi:hypothetical protein
MNLVSQSPPKMANTTTITKANVHKTPKFVSFTPPVRSSKAIYAWFLHGIGVIWLFIQDCYYWVQSPREFLSCAVFLYLGNYTVIQPWLRNGVPSLDGKLFLARMAHYLNIYWGINYFNSIWHASARTWPTIDE